MSLSARHMVGRCGPDDLPGGAVTILKAAAKVGGWFTWTTAGTITKPVKTKSTLETGGAAEYEDRPFPRVHVKGDHRDGRRFVMRYVQSGDKWTADAAYVLTREHAATTDDGETVTWTSERATFDRCSVAELKAYLAAEPADVPSQVSA